MTTLQTANRGNLAIETQVWKLSIEDAKKLVKWMKTENIPHRVGSVWHSVVVKPIRSAIVRKAEVASLYTAGFSTGELANFLANAGISYSILADV